MKYRRKIKVGETEIEIENEVSSIKEFWKEMAFWDTLPQAGPNGEGVLQFSYRTPKGNEYFSLLAPEAKMEFMYGMLKKDSEVLYPKEWRRAKHGQFRSDDDDEHPGELPATNAETAKAMTTATTTTTTITTTKQPPSQTEKEQLIEAVLAELNRLNWIQTNRHRRFLLEELSAEAQDWTGEGWCLALLRAASEKQLAALVAKLKTYGKPERVKLDGALFWHTCTNNQIRREVGNDIIKRHTSKGETNWAKAQANLLFRIALKQRACGDDVAQAVLRQAGGDFAKARTLLEQQFKRPIAA